MARHVRVPTQQQIGRPYHLKATWDQLVEEAVPTGELERARFMELCTRLLEICLEKDEYAPEAEEIERKVDRFRLFNWPLLLKRVETPGSAWSWTNHAQALWLLQCKCRAVACNKHRRGARRWVPVTPYSPEEATMLSVIQPQIWIDGDFRVRCKARDFPALYKARACVAPDRPIHYYSLEQFCVALSAVIARWRDLDFLEPTVKEYIDRLRVVCSDFICFAQTRERMDSKRWRTEPSKKTPGALVICNQRMVVDTDVLFYEISRSTSIQQFIIVNKETQPSDAPPFVADRLREWYDEHRARIYFDEVARCIALRVMRYAVRAGERSRYVYDLERADTSMDAIEGLEAREVVAEYRGTDELGALDAIPDQKLEHLERDYPAETLFEVYSYITMQELDVTLGNFYIDFDMLAHEWPELTSYFSRRNTPAIVYTDHARFFVYSVRTRNFRDCGKRFEDAFLCWMWEAYSSMIHFRTDKVVGFMARVFGSSSVNNNGAPVDADMQEAPVAVSLYSI